MTARQRWMAAVGVVALVAVLPRTGAQGGIDLTVEALDRSGVATDTQTLAVSGSIAVTVRNLGGTGASASTVRAFEDRNGDGRYESAIDGLLGEAPTPAVGGLATAVVSVPLAGTQAFAGNLIHVEADAARVIGETDETNNVRHTGQSSTFTAASDGLQAVLAWVRDSFTQQPLSRNVRSTPAVGDLDGDGYPEVVFNSSNYLRILDGRTGAEKLTVVNPADRVETDAGVTIGDLDRNGVPEIYTFDRLCRAIAFNPDGSVRWRGAESGHASCWSAVALGDLDTDGTPEVVAGHHVYSPTGVLRWSASAGRGGPFGSMPVLADINLDGALEVVMGNTAYRADGTVLFDRRATYGEAYPAVGNLDDDPEAEIVFKLRSPSMLVVLEHDGTTKWSIPLAGIAGGGAPTIADFDNDGVADIGVSGTIHYRVHRRDGTLMWFNSIHDTSSGVTSSTVFDFDDDGSSEVVFADEEYLYIWKGSDGSELFRTPRGSTTGAESPVVVDVDADGHADVVVPRDGRAGLAGVDTFGIAVYSGANRDWANTRRVWNQPSYSITHIGDDLIVPTTFTPNWQVPGLNNFRLNTFDPRTGAAPSLAPDLTASLLRRDDSGFPGRTYLSVRVGNGGGALAPVARVSLTVDDQEVCLIDTPTALAPGAFADVTCPWINPVQGTRRVTATVDAANVIREGDEGNNVAAALLLIGVGPALTVDALTVRARDAGAEVRWQPVPGAVAYNIYRQVGSAGFLLHRSALPASTTVFVDSRLTNNVVHWYAVRALDAAGVESGRGTEASATPIPRTQRGDTAPTITSTPLTRIRAGDLFAYRVRASDPDAGETLTYALASAPAGMTIDAASGRMEWRPSVTQAGPCRVMATVTDRRGRVTSQGFTVFVETQFTNTAPTFTSTPSPTATAGRAYAYAAQVTDPDAGDVTSFDLVTAPTGMVIHAATGLVSWMPGPTEVGAHVVVVRARDLAGYDTTQAFTLTVGNPNRAPVITSTAPGVTLLGATWAYQATATDPDAGDMLAWTLAAGPTGAVIDPATGLLRWTPDAVGDVTFTIEVADVLGAFARQTFVLAVGALSNGAPTFTSAPVTVAEVSALWAYAARAEDPDGDSVSYALITGPVGMSLTAEGVMTWTPPASAIGSVPVEIRAADLHGGVTTQAFTIEVAAIDTQAPTVTFVAPEAEAEVEGFVPIVGTASDPQLVSWTLDYQVAGGTTWTRLAEGDSSVEAGELARFPAGLLASRPYVLRLSARDRRQSAVTQRRLVVGGDVARLGAFTLEYTDVRVPAGAMPVAIERRYDSSRPYWNDFGRGWALGFSTLDLRVDGSYHVRVTLPSGRDTAFTFAPQSLGFAGVAANRYLAAPGIQASLENLDCPNVLASGTTVLCVSGTTALGTYAPRRWRLTTGDGVAYTIEDSAVTRVDDRNGNWLSIGATGVHSSTGQQVQFVRDGAGRITQLVDARGSRVQYAYDETGRLTTVTDQASRTTAFAYLDDSHLITTITADDGCVGLRQEFDADGRLSARVDAAGRRTSYSYDLTGRAITTQGNGATTVEVFNAAGDTIRFTDGEGHVTTHTYDAGGRRLATVLPGGRRLERTYDAAGNPLTAATGGATGPMLTTHYAWTPQQLLARLTHANGDHELFDYDVRGNLTRRRILSAAGTLVTEQVYGYDTLGRLVSEQSARGNLAFVYDEAGNLVRREDAAGRVQHFRYDVNGRVVTTFTPEGQPIHTDRDAYGQVVAHRTDSEVLATMGWTANEDLASIGDGLGHTYGFTYGCSAALASVSDPAGGVTSYDHDLFGAPTRMVDALGRETTWAYDGNGRRVARVSPAGDTIGHVWSPEGKEAGRTVGSRSVSATFDAYGRLHVQTEPDRVKTYTYDERHRVIAIVTTGAEAGTHTFAYDAAGNVTSTTDRFGHTVTYAYDTRGRRTSMTSPYLSVPGGLTTTYAYDAGGMLARIATGTASADLTYDAAGRLASVRFGNGVRGDRTWDAAGRLQSLTWTGPSGAVLRGWTFTYDPAGRPIHAALDDGSVAWTYDALGRLTSEAINSATGGARLGAWTYDAVGNRLDAGASFGLDHRLASHGTTPYAHVFDDAGNSTRIGSTANGYLLRYDVFNRLVQTPFGSMRYNAMGARDETTGSQARRYLYDGLNPVAIADGAIVEHRYTHGLTTDEVFFAHNNGAVRYYLTDHVGSVVALTDEAGAVTRRYAYDAWGEPYHAPSAVGQALGGVNFNPFRFQGREWLEFVELYHFRAREYAAAYGRFMQKDPAPGVSELPASRHPYMFAFNRPTQFVDPLGEAAIDYDAMITKNPLAGFGGAVAGFGAGYSGTMLAYLGFFLEAHVADPGADISESSSQAISSATALIESVLEAYTYKAKGATVQKGLKIGASMGTSQAAAWLGANAP